MISVSREYLSNGLPSSPGTVRSLRLLETHLTAVIQNSRASQSPLLDRESLPPNQCTWTETAERMGAKRRKRPHHTNSMPTTPATERIGKLNHKQPHMKNTDLYSSGLQPGKNAAPDTQTAAQNADARSRASVTNAGEPLPSQPSKRRCKHTSTPPPPPSSVPVAGPSVLRSFRTYQPDLGGVEGRVLWRDGSPRSHSRAKRGIGCITQAHWIANYYGTTPTFGKISPGTSSSGLFWTILRQATCQGHVTAIPSGPIPKAPGSGSRVGRGIDRSPRVSNTRSLPAALLQRRFLRRLEAKPRVASPTKGP
ncbi:hypothetical protein EDB86DRAFT_2830635 [Lactarius hatsudake]|nr:hypothetical protein EDB86DRAFT_2830635 [Lactarius hatsudake]